MPRNQMWPSLLAMRTPRIIALLKEDRLEEALEEMLWCGDDLHACEAVAAAIAKQRGTAPYHCWQCGHPFFLELLTPFCGFSCLRTWRLCRLRLGIPSAGMPFAGFAIPDPGLRQFRPTPRSRFH
jgi:hypothetical protein